MAPFGLSLVRETTKGYLGTATDGSGGADQPFGNITGSHTALYLGGGKGSGSGSHPSRFATRYRAGLRLNSRLICVEECFHRVIVSLPQGVATIFCTSGPGLVKENLAAENMVLSLLDL